jgi:hypothetical protein
LDDLRRLNRPDRLFALLEILYVQVDRKDGANCAELLQSLWPDFEGGLSRENRRLITNAFRLAGFVSDTPDKNRPTTTMRLYRGSTPSRRSGLSWTESLERARWFANRQHLLTGGKAAFVYEIDAEPIGC